MNLLVERVINRPISAKRFSGDRERPNPGAYPNPRAGSFASLTPGLLLHTHIASLFLLAAIASPLLSGAAPEAGASVRKESVQGYLVDLVCVKEEAGRLHDLGPSHTRKCLQMPACIQGGYAVLLASNEVLALDVQGNELARKLVASRHKQKGFLIKATGRREGNRFLVLRIEFE